jgi:hypothetical protein
MKKLVEWRDGDVWRQVNVEVAYSRNNNYWFKHAGTVYVFPLLKEGTEIVMKNTEGKWIKAGRVAFGCIFLGDGKTYYETNNERFLNEKWINPVMS